MRAFVAEKTDDGVTRGVRDFTLDAEGDGVGRPATPGVGRRQVHGLGRI